VVPWIRIPARSRTPFLGSPLSVGEIDERPAGEERATHEGHHPHHPWLVLWSAHPGRIEVEPACLGVLDERLIQPIPMNTSLSWSTPPSRFNPNRSAAST
jgi:hypothetical protein